MQLVAPSEDDSISATPEIPGILRVHCSVHKSRPLILIQSQNNPIKLHRHIFMIHFNITHQRLAVPSGLFSWIYSIKLHLLSFPMRATRRSRLNFLDFIMLISSGEECKLWSYLLCSFRQASDTLSHLGPIFPAEPCSQTPSVYIPLIV